MMRYLTFDDQLKAISELIRVTKPGGRIDLIDYDRTDYDYEVAPFVPEDIIYMLENRTFSSQNKNLASITATEIPTRRSMGVGYPSRLFHMILTVGDTDVQVTPVEQRRETGVESVSTADLVDDSSIQVRASTVDLPAAGQVQTHTFIGDGREISQRWQSEHEGEAGLDVPINTFIPQSLYAFVPNLRNVGTVIMPNEEGFEARNRHEFFVTVINPASIVDMEGVAHNIDLVATTEEENALLGGYYRLARAGEVSITDTPLMHTTLYCLGGTETDLYVDDFRIHPLLPNIVAQHFYAQLRKYAQQQNYSRIVYRTDPRETVMGINGRPYTALDSSVQARIREQYGEYEELFVDDFSPIADNTSSPDVISSPTTINTLEGYIQWCKANPGALTVGETVVIPTSDGPVNYHKQADGITDRTMDDYLAELFSDQYKIVIDAKTGEKSLVERDPSNFVAGGVNGVFVVRRTILVLGGGQAVGPAELSLSYPRIRSIRYHVIDEGYTNENNVDGDARGVHLFNDSPDKLNTLPAHSVNAVLSFWEGLAEGSLDDIVANLTRVTKVRRGVFRFHKYTGDDQEMLKRQEDLVAKLRNQGWRIRLDTENLVVALSRSKPLKEGSMARPSNELAANRRAEVIRVAKRRIQRKRPAIDPRIMASGQLPVGNGRIAQAIRYLLENEGRTDLTGRDIGKLVGVSSNTIFIATQTLSSLERYEAYLRKTEKPVLAVPSTEEGWNDQKFIKELSIFIRREARSILKDPDVIDDLVQTGSESIFNHRDGLTMADISGYAYTTGYNGAISYLRSFYAKHTFSAGEAGVDYEEKNPQVPNPDENIADRSMMMDVLRKSVSIDHANVVYLYYYRRKKVKQIAVELGIPPGTVKSRLHYARRKLRKVLPNLE